MKRRYYHGYALLVLAVFAGISAILVLALKQPSMALMMLVGMVVTLVKMEFIYYPYFSTLHISKERIERRVFGMLHTALDRAAVHTYPIHVNSDSFVVFSLDELEHYWLGSVAALCRRHRAITYPITDRMREDFPEIFRNLGRNTAADALHITNLATDLSPIYPGGQFDLARWEETLRAENAELADLCLKDMNADVEAGMIDFDRDLLPVLNAAFREEGERARAIASFEEVTAGLEERIRACFGRSVEADVILYPGLCNGAGWVTTLRGKDAILLGIEKIVELRWNGVDDMRGLIFHELGHVYQSQYGVLAQDCANDRQQFLWQLFTEGIAMRFEQLLVGDGDYFHQDKGGWKDWCGAHLQQIKADFLADLDTMRRENQRWFGDWVSYEGRGDVGYYLGAKFVDFICRERDFDDILALDAETVEKLYLDFAQTKGSADA